jgi:hypothetical protein
MRRLLAATLLATWAATMAALPVLGALGDWTTSYNASPDGATDTGDILDDQLRTLKAEIQMRAKKELDWGTAAFETGYTDTGRANPGSARAFLQNSAPTSLRRFDNSGNQTSGSLTDNDVGRLWVDFNEGLSLSVYTCGGGDPEPASDCSGTNAFSKVIAVGDPPTPAAGSSTSSAAIDGTGTGTALAYSTGTDDITIPAGGIWWVRVDADVHVICTSLSTVRVDLVSDSGAATTVDMEESIISANTSRTFNLHFGGAASSAATIAYSAFAEASTANCSFNGGTGGTHLTGNGGFSRVHRVYAETFPAP